MQHTSRTLSTGRQNRNHIDRTIQGSQSNLVKRLSVHCPSVTRIAFSALDRFRKLAWAMTRYHVYYDTDVGGNHAWRIFTFF
jgi:hypothetical protein